MWTAMISDDSDSFSPLGLLGHAVAAAVILALLSALYLVCSDQVGRAQARQQALQAQSAAVLDCLADSSQTARSVCRQRVNLAYR